MILRTFPWDLRAVAVLALVVLLGSALPLPSWLRFLLMLPLVLLLPGYAITAATFPRALPGTENLVYTLAFSICAAILGGVLVQILLPLTAAVWTVLLTATTLGACTVAARRRESGGIAVTPFPSLPGIGAPAALLFALAFAIAAWSVALATDGAHDQADAARFTSLWIVPKAAADGGGAVVGVENQEGARARYLLVVRSRGRERSRRIPLQLDDGEVRTIRLGAWATPETKATVARLHRDGRLYRLVRLSPEAGT